MLQRLFCRIARPLASLGLLCICAGAAAAEITLHFHERVPYAVLKDGHLGGLAGTPAVAAFHKSGIPFRLSATPPPRQLALFRAATGLDCGIGWFKNPEREGFAKFTKPIYQDEPQVALTSANHPRLRSGGTVEQVLSDKRYMLLVKQGYSYGTALDALIARHQPDRHTVVVDNVAMVKMIQLNHADYMFIAPEEVDAVLASAELKPDDVRVVSFVNAPRGELRYIMCSKAVPDEVVDRLNAAIN